MPGLEQYGIPYDPQAAHQLHWQQGQFGKGILAKDGTLHTWNTSRQDGDPNHRRYMMESPAFGYDPYPTPEFRGNNDHTYFWVDPDGALFMLNKGQPENVQRILQLDPRLYHPKLDTDEWRFSDYRNQQRGVDDEILDMLAGPAKEPRPLSPEQEALEQRRREWAEEAERKRQEWQADPIGYERTNNWDIEGDVGRHPDIEWVPTNELSKFMEYDRRPGGTDSTNNVERWEALKSHIDQHGFKNPVVLEFNPDTNMAHMGEGNHRTQIAQDLGIPAMPVRVYRSRRTSPTQIPVTPKPEPTWLDHRGELRYPDSLKPSHIGLPTVPPPEQQTRISRLTKLYHVTPAKNRDSIKTYGLMGHDASTPGYWDEHSPQTIHKGQPRGNYFFEDPQTARAYVAELAQRHHSPERWVYPGDVEPRLRDQVESHPGFDIWEVDPQGLELGQDPEIWLGQGRSFLRDPWGSDMNPDPAKAWNGTDWARWFTPNPVEANRLQLHEHVPLRDINDVWANDAHGEAPDVPYDYLMLNPRQVAPKRVAPEVADAWNL